MTPSVRTFGKYLLDEEIARGGMSRVHLARLRGLGGFEKRLVVKQVLPELASDPRFVSMFVQEAKTLVQMSHPHIVPVFELGVVDGVYFLAMEYVEGATLSQILAQGPLAPELVAHLGAEVCDALHYAHDRFGIVHRDVNPRNVIVDPEGHSRLLDFGIAAPADDEGTELFGTPGYLSPEQLEGEVGPASDIFSLGAALYEALSGRQAFPAMTVEESRAALDTSGPGFGDDDVPPELAAIVLRALERDPSDRYETARELGRALRGFVASHSPQGVAPELGACAVLAESQVQREREARALRDEEEGPADSGGEVTTLAANRDFEQLVSRSERPPALEEPVGTKPIEGRRSLPPEVDEAPAGTQPIEGRRSLAPEPEEGGEPAGEETARGETARGETARGETARAEASPGAEVRSARPTPAPPDRRALWFGVASVAVVGVGLYAIFSTPPPPVERDAGVGALVAPPRDAGPPEAPSAPDAGPAAPTDAGAPDAGSPGTEPGTNVEPRARASLTVNATPWAQVVLDGRALGTTPQRDVPIRAGPHTVELRNEYLAAPVSRRFEASPGSRVRILANLEAENPTVQVRVLN